MSLVENSTGKPGMMRVLVTQHCEKKPQTHHLFKKRKKSLRGLLQGFYFNKREALSSRLWNVGLKEVESVF